jgi:ADP-ribosylglycohydrolase
MGSSIVGSLLGTAVGDALGLPYEAISRRRAARLWGEPAGYRFFLGRGMVSDDTEHTCIVAQALAASGGDPGIFARKLAWGLRWWLLGLPAGIGFATLRATIKLWLGFPPKSSGVFSAGNGPAMRSAVIGAAIADRERMRKLVAVNTRITHRDPKAFHGALAVALAAHDPGASGEEFLARVTRELPDAKEFVDLVARAVKSAAAGETTPAFAAAVGLGQGITGYVYHTVPACIHAWLAHRGDYRGAVMDIVRCGGDTDTTAAIVGGIVGSGVGRDGIPAEWRAGLFEWPRSVAWMERLAASLEFSAAQGKPVSPPRLFGPWILVRNVFFIAVVLVHVARRCLPPY